MQHINPGEPIRASMLNQLIDHADGVTEGQIGGIPNFRVSSTTIRVQADADLPRYAVVGIDDILFDPSVNKEAFAKEPAVKAGQPDAATKNFAILQRPAASGQIVPACVLGVSIPSCMGLAIDDNNIPQLISCDTIPFACCVPVLKVNCLYRITQQTASPAYLANSYPVSLGNKNIILGTVNYLPGNSPNCS